MKRRTNISKLFFFAVMIMTLAVCKKEDTANPKTTSELLVGTHNGICYTHQRRFYPMLTDIRDTILNSSLTLTPEDDNCFMGVGCGTDYWAPMCVILNDTTTVYKSSFHAGSVSWNFELNTTEKTIHTTRMTILQYGFDSAEGFFSYD